MKAYPEDVGLKLKLHATMKVFAFIVWTSGATGQGLALDWRLPTKLLYLDFC